MQKEKKREYSMNSICVFVYSLVYVWTQLRLCKCARERISLARIHILEQERKRLMNKGTEKFHSECVGVWGMINNKFTSNAMWRQRRNFILINWVSRQVVHVTLSVALKLSTSYEHIYKKFWFIRTVRISRINKHNRNPKPQRNQNCIDKCFLFLFLFLN